MINWGVCNCPGTVCIGTTGSTTVTVTYYSSNSPEHIMLPATEWKPPKRWDDKAFITMPLFIQRLIRVAEIGFYVVDGLGTRRISIMRLPPRRLFAVGVRYALCSTRVI